jgi:hypothetical protein
LHIWNDFMDIMIKKDVGIAQCSFWFL